MAILSVRRNGVSHFYHHDGLGSTVQLTDANQNVTDSYVYRAFGEEQAVTGTTPNPLRFVGDENYYTDGGSGLELLGVRPYEPMEGRFTTKDPIMEGLNWFVYVGSNPVNMTDPTGNQGWEEVLTGVAAWTLAQQIAAAAGMTVITCLATPWCREKILTATQSAFSDLAEQTAEKVQKLGEKCKEWITKKPKWAGDCYPLQHNLLQAPVDYWCNIPRKCDGLVGKANCQKMVENLLVFYSCIAARETINKKCFKGGNKGHKDAVKENTKGAKECFKRIMKYCGS